jgi:hypothetical protein
MLKLNLYTPLFILSLVSLFSCTGIIKNNNPKVIVEEGTQIDSSNIKEPKKENNILGNYVGMFEVDVDDSLKWDNAVYAGEAFYWLRENKISICIDSIGGNSIKGHSVVAGNETIFEGNIKKVDSAFIVEAKEPGTNKNDGAFNFVLKDTIIKGTWKAFAKIDISNRKYKLIKREFVYNPNQLLDEKEPFVNFTKPEVSEAEIKKLLSKMTEEEKEENFELLENSRFASATDKIYSLNASTTLLTEKQVANLSKGDLSIIRNTIYARHGYSFKNRPLRVFFDRQTWYIPVNTNIKNAFTEIEKKNIQLLLRYEKFAKEYYDNFGRG